MKIIKNIIMLFFGVLPLSGNLYAQLKDNNFLMADSANKNIEVSKTTSEGNKFLTLRNTGFKYENDLTFFYQNKGPGYCCNYYETKEIPKSWNIITVKDIVAHMEDKKSGINFIKKKLFFIEYDKDRKIYKAYQVDVVGWSRPD